MNSSHSEPLARTDIGESSILLQCPLCGGDVDYTDHGYRCTACGRDFERYRGIPDFNTTPMQSTALIQTTSPDTFLDSAEHSGWRHALESLDGKEAPGVLRATSRNRIAWSRLVELSPSSRIIDIGGGSGGVACQLAERCSVVAVDGCRVNAAFMQTRARQDNLHNLSAFAADATRLPFRSGQFDLASMIGVLEWVPVAWPNLDPKQVQMNALREINRVLVPGGSLFFAIENRYYIGYFLGEPDPHTHIPQMTTVSRSEAETLSQQTRRKPYREWTHSRQVYEEMLWHAGFECIETYWLYPDYLWNHYIVPIGSLDAVDAFTKNHLDIRAFEKDVEGAYYFLKYTQASTVVDFVLCYGFTARKPG